MMPVTTAPGLSLSNTRVAQTHPEVARAPRRRTDRIESQIPNVQMGSTFSLVLQASAGNIDVHPARTDVASATQMFDAPQKGSQTQSGAGNGLEERGASSAVEDARLDRTSVDARMAAAKVQTESLQSRQQTSGSRADVASDATRGRTVGTDVAGVRQNQAESIRTIVGHSGNEISTLRTGESSSMQTRLSPSHNSGVGNVATVAPANANALSKVERGETPADQVGRLLATSRPSGAQSGRAVNGVSTNGQAQSAQSRQSFERLAPQSRSSGKYEGTQQNQASTSTQRSEFDQLIRSIRMTTSPHRSTARLQLNPPRLGRVRVDVRMEGQMLRIDVQTETGEARQLINERLAELRSALENHGLHLDRVTVNVEAGASQDANAVSGTDQQTRRRDDENLSDDQRDEETTLTNRVDGKLEQPPGEATPAIGLHGQLTLDGVGDRRLDIRA